MSHGAAKYRFLLLAIACSLALSACSYTQAVTQTNVPSERSHPVAVDVKRYIFFGTFDDDEIDPLTKKLQEKCPGGRVLGILTKDVHIFYILNIFWAREVMASGYCIKGNTVSLPDHEPADAMAALELREP